MKPLPSIVKNIFVISVPLLLALTLSCKHEIGRETSLVSGAEATSIDATILHSELVEASSDCRNPLTNLFVSSFTDGLLRNGAIADGGVNNPVGKKMTTDSLYFQVVRIVSIFDYELAEGIKDPKLTPCLPKHLGVHLGTFSKTYVNSLSSSFPGDIKKLKEAAQIIKSDIGEFQVVSFDAKENIKFWPGASALPARFLAALQQGVREKMQTAARSRNQNNDLQEKVRGMASSYAPLYVSLNTNYNRAQTQTYVEAYMPPLYELKDANADDLTRWKLTKGLARHVLPRPADISIAKLTHIGYLQDPDPRDTMIIKTQLFKDLKDPNRIRTRIIFGKWAENGPEKGALNIDYRDYRTALYVGFHPYLAIKPGDNLIVRKAKEQINASTSQYKIDARIHRLALDLVRTPPTTKSKASDLIYRPKFSLKDSDISFRLHQAVGEGIDLKILKKLGFNCDTVLDGKTDCFRDFGVYTELTEFFLQGENSKPQEKNLLTRIGGAFRTAMNRVIALNVKFVIDGNIRVIEDAIDNQFEQIFMDIVDQQNDLHKKINDRIESKLFDTDK